MNDTVPSGRRVAWTGERPIAGLAALRSWTTGEKVSTARAGSAVANAIDAAAIATRRIEREAEGGLGIAVSYRGRGVGTTDAAVRNPPARDWWAGRGTGRTPSRR